MAIKFRNPPVIYAVAKLIFSETIASYPKERYEKLLISIEALGFDSYIISKITGIQFKQADNNFSVAPTTAERIGYFNANRTKCAIIDENSVELRLTDYSNHTEFLNTISEIMETLKKHEITIANRLKEIELHYVDLFVPKGFPLQNMFNGITLPNNQFYSEEGDKLQVGAIHFTRVLSSAREKVSVTLEQLKSLDPSQRKQIPDSLVEPDRKLAMPINTERLFAGSSSGEYALVHTHCGALTEETEISSDLIRKKFEVMYQESRKTFDAMIRLEVCSDVWMQVEF